MEIRPLQTVEVVNRFLGKIIALGIVGLLSVLSWLGYNVYHDHNADRFALEETQAELAEQKATIDGLNDRIELDQEKIGELNEDVEKKRVEINRLELVMKLLTVDHRVAEIRVIDQQGSAEDGDLMTKFSFVELGPEEQPLDQPREFTIEGDLLYVDAWVVKFDDELIGMSDSTRPASVYLFRRVFGEKQPPSEGYALDTVGVQPTIYGTPEEPSAWEKDLWSRFWDYANNPELAKTMGVRAAHGEAPSIKLTPESQYRIELRASGGLSLVAEPLKDMDRRLSRAF